MTSHMFFMIDGWNVPHHILNDYCFQQLVYNNFNTISHFFIY
jgi:hypothetical protein